MDIKTVHTQDIYLELMRRSSFNNFDGDKVTGDLESNRDLWKAAAMSRDFYGGELMHLRDMCADHNHADTLYILTTKQHEAALEALTRSWEADEVDWETDERAAQLLGRYPCGDSAILRVWWD